MEKGRLLELVKQVSDVDAIMMILSNSVDYGSPQGGLVSVNKFKEVAECLIEWQNSKKEHEITVKNIEAHRGFLVNLMGELTTSDVSLIDKYEFEATIDSLKKNLE